jgi:hypothetical protein
MHWLIQNLSNKFMISDYDICIFARVGIPSTWLIFDFKQPIRNCVRQSVIGAFSIKEVMHENNPKNI